jgi:hypothetical protein
VLQPPQTYIPGLSEQARQTQLPGLRSIFRLGKS